jgi:hypothetical protein
MMKTLFKRLQYQCCILHGKEFNTAVFALIAKIGATCAIIPPPSSNSYSMLLHTCPAFIGFTEACCRRTPAN